VLGDNIFYGQGFSTTLQQHASSLDGCVLFGYQVKDPERYGVVEIGSDGRALGLEEKPAEPKSHFAVTGLYFYDNDVVEIARTLKPSARGEYEITDVNREYLRRDRLHVELLGRGMAWFDTGTHESLLAAGTFIEAIENRQGLMIASPEEIAFREGYVDAEQLERVTAALGKSSYGAYLRQVLNEQSLRTVSRSFGDD
jgi:glucose-1-phosphate thymidylyltransferase